MYTLFNVVENKIIAELISDAAMMNKFRDIVIENEDFEDYCQNLVLLSDSEINNFLTEFGIKVQENEDSAYVELMMDDHKCIEFKGTQYYINEDTPLTANEEKIFDTLVYCCHV